MVNNQDRINYLLNKLDILSARQEQFFKEIKELRDEVSQLQISETIDSILEEKEEIIVTPPTKSPFELQREKVMAEMHKEPEQQYEEPKKETPRYTPPNPKYKSDLEKFIGENLINKIGIFITIIGVGIGAKYSIDHQLISPLARILLGYLVGIGLLGFGFKLKKKYENFSAVLVSGAMAIMYFITLAAYSFYDLFPQAVAFALMVIFTIFTVLAALAYDNQIIALIGLVGAYGVPFLLSDGSGKVAILYSYMSIINVGILIIAFKKYWKPLYYSAFILTWVIFSAWYSSQYKFSDHFALALVFLTVFFFIFYTTFLAYKLYRKEKFEVEDIMLLLANSFVFYGFGYSILFNQIASAKFLGLFTLTNAIIHLGVSTVIYKQKLGDKNLFYLVVGLFIVFVTIAIPVELSGNWVTLLWVGEAALLFWIGRTKSVAFYEIMSYPLMFISAISLFHDLKTYQDTISFIAGTKHIPILNITFFSALLFIAAFVFINFINTKKENKSAIVGNSELKNLISYAIPAILIVVTFFTFFFEITNYWDHLYLGTKVAILSKGQSLETYYMNYDLKKFEIIWQLIYFLSFSFILSYLNFKKFKNANLGLINVYLNTFAIILFLTLGLFQLSELRESYLSQYLAQYYDRGIWHLGIRYFSFVFVAALLIATFNYSKQTFMNIKMNIEVDIILYISILWIASSELINWMDIAHSTQSYKLGLSILWGIYSLLLIALGIWKKKKHLRIGAIVLFALTLLKLFLYDISYLDTISKTIVFVSLGILLLIISFLYNKYKSFMMDEEE